MTKKLVFDIAPDVVGTYAVVFLPDVHGCTPLVVSPHAELLPFIYIHNIY